MPLGAFSSWRTLSHLWLVRALAAIGLLALTASAHADDFEFEFNLDGVLPSAQGATYFGQVSETTAFSVSGGLLHQSQLSGAQGAVYEMPHFLNHHYDATITWSSRLFSSSGGPFGDAVELFDSDASVYRAWQFGFQADGIYKDDTTRILSMDPTDRMHVYQVFIPHDSDAYQLFLDGTLRYSGTAYVNTASTDPDPGMVYWGDGTLHDQDARVDWDFVRFSNHAPEAVPEPAFYQTGGLLVLGVIGFVRLRRKTQIGQR